MPDRARYRAALRATVLKARKLALTLRVIFRLLPHIVEDFDRRLARDSSRTGTQQDCRGNSQGRQGLTARPIGNSKTDNSQTHFATTSADAAPADSSTFTHSSASNC